MSHLKKIWIFSLFLHENICCDYQLEAPRRGASNGYSQHMFSWRNKTKIFIVISLLSAALTTDVLLSLLLLLL